MRRVLGIDIGGVIIDRVNDHTDTSFFGKNYLQTTAVEDAIPTISRLTEMLNGHVHLVSKCGPTMQEKTMHWLSFNRFTDATGIESEQVHFCRERQQKAKICRQLGITHFVDDRLEVLGYLVGEVQNLFLFAPDRREVQRFRQFLPMVHRVLEWHEVEKCMIEEL